MSFGASEKARWGWEFFPPKERVSDLHTKMAFWSISSNRGPCWSGLAPEETGLCSKLLFAGRTESLHSETEISTLSSIPMLPTTLPYIQFLYTSIWTNKIKSKEPVRYFFYLVWKIFVQFLLIPVRSQRVNAFDFVLQLSVVTAQV